MKTTTRSGGAGPAWFTTNGRPHRGEVGEDADGMPFGAGELACATCGGSGMSRHATNRQCRGCMGEKVTYQQFRIYDAEGLVALRLSRSLGAVPKARRPGRVRRQAAGRDPGPGGSKAGEGGPRTAGTPPGRPAKGRGHPPGRRAGGSGRARPPSRSEEAMRDTYDEYRASHAGLFDRAEAVSNDFVRDLLAKAREWGSLTEGQRLKMEEVVGGIERGRSVHAGSGYVGAVKDRFDVGVTCTEHRTFVARKFKGRGVETKHVTAMVDRDGNVFMAVTPTFSMSPGDTATITGTVSKHEERDGYLVTFVGRVVARDHVPAPPGWAPEPWEPPSRPPAAAAPVDDGYDADFEELDAPSPGM